MTMTVKNILDLYTRIINQYIIKTETNFRTSRQQLENWKLRQANNCFIVQKNTSTLLSDQKKNRYQQLKLQIMKLLTPSIKLLIPIRAYVSLKEEQVQAITKRYRFQLLEIIIKKTKRIKEDQVPATSEEQVVQCTTRILHFS